MRIGIYHQHGNAVIGGAEYVVVVMAEALASEHRVEIVHHKPGLTGAALARTYGVDLAGVTFRLVPEDTSALPWTTPLRRFLHERSRYASVLRSYDLVIASVSDIPPFCPAKRGALFVHFPYPDQVTAWPWKRDGFSPREVVRSVCARAERNARFAGYQVVMVNSAYTRDWTQRLWGLSSHVVYAPAGVEPRVVRKQDMVLAVGRFTASGTRKHQREMVTAFRELCQDGLSGWELHVIGGVSPAAADHRYLQDVVAAAGDSPVQVETNIERDRLEDLYHRGRIFWHAAGLEAGDSDPGMVEHFGLATVEAMSAGCVPVVIGRGGQVEIVEHGVSGFLWQTLAELKEYTLRLIQDPALLERMSESARARAAHFSRRAFAERVVEALQPLLRP
ncbi:MAG: glycosyltransferase family 4 protein [Gemmatimonadales bacterium]